MSGRSVFGLGLIFAVMACVGLVLVILLDVRGFLGWLLMVASSAWGIAGVSMLCCAKPGPPRQITPDQVMADDPMMREAVSLAYNRGKMVFGCRNEDDDFIDEMYLEDMRQERREQGWLN